MSSTLETIKRQKLNSSAIQVNNKVMNLAASWYIAIPSKDLGKKPKVIELFGQSLIAWRDKLGHPVIMEQYCSHMGASLAIGKVVDDCIRCPYHHWRYDSSGQCVFIPEVEHIPPTARQTTYVTAERYGYIWVWYGTQTPLFPIPEFAAAEAQKHNYMSLHSSYYTTTTVLRLTENAYDYHHVVALHGQKVYGSIQVTVLKDSYSELNHDLPIQQEAWFGAVAEYPVREFVGGNAKPVMYRVDSWPSGQIATAFLDGKERLKILIGTTPIGENKTIFQTLLMIKKTGNFLLNIFHYLLFTNQIKATTWQDVEVWNTLNSDVGRAYVKHDRALLKFREFYQRWVDKVESSDAKTRSCTNTKFIVSKSD